MKSQKKIEEQFFALNSVPIGMFVLREDYTVIFWNKCIEDWTGILKKNIESKNIFDFFPNLNAPKYISRINTIFEGGAPAILSSQLHRYIIPALFPDGTYRFQHTTITSVQAVGENNNLALFAIEDVTDLTKRINDYRNMHAKALEEVRIRQEAESELNMAIKELESFSYTVSHDLKAPLRGVLGYAHELKNRHSNNLDDRGKFCTTQISLAAKNLNDLIDELLKYSRLGGRQVSLSTFSIVGIINSVLEERKTIIQEKNIAVSIDISFDIIHSWEIGVSLVLANIIDNAIKYSSKTDSPDVSIIGKELPDYYSISVTDNGVGFDMKYHDRMFGLFNRLVTENEFEGSGAGLAIVKKIMEKLKGKVWATSELGQGASFFIELPKINRNSSDNKPIIT